MTSWPASFAPGRHGCTEKRPAGVRGGGERCAERTCRNLGDVRAVGGRPRMRDDVTALFLICVLPGAWATAADEPAVPAGVAAVLKGHTEPVYAIAFTPDGKYVVTGSFDKTLKLWETATGKEVKTFGGQAGHQNLVLSLAISPDGQSLASGSSDNTAKVWDIPSSSPLRNFVNTDAVNGVALSPDGTKLAAAGKDGSVKLCNTADAKQLFNLTGHSGA